MEYPIPMECSTDGRSIESTPFDRNFSILVDVILSIDGTSHMNLFDFPQIITIV